MVRVLPVPAPASTHTGPRGASTASRCWSSSPAINGSLAIDMTSILAAVDDRPGVSPRRGACDMNNCRAATPPGSSPR
ncbi:Uncharacterised protein [Mycobacterium tuberculosis]|nr:Uncharacterised protein [Mycobacterium tuberculosis]COW76720.1 Uncharacterised protein [Mycobacterium tuberculosis]